MKKLMLALVLAGLAMTSMAQQTTPATVSVNAKGDDVRSVIHDLFQQAGKNYVLKPGVRFVLYLSLDKVEFDEALTIICKNASLKYEVQNGIYHISNAPVKVEEPKPVIEEKKPEEKKPEPKQPEKVAPPAKFVKRLPTSILAKRITTRYSKTDLRKVMDTLADQSGAPIEVAKDVPAYKLDAFLINTSLKYALDQITKATKLEYHFTDEGTILISPAKSAQSVRESDEKKG
ncbi:MAG: hypothetical protein J0H02_10090 [Armatimonadetes bacterium]|nr:hypothetical protein [Armatimonadota bacterium]